MVLRDNAICLKWPDESEDLIAVPERHHSVEVAVFDPLSCSNPFEEKPIPTDGHLPGAYTLTFKDTGRKTDNGIAIYEITGIRRA